MGDSPLARTVAQSRLDGSKTIITPKKFYEMLVRLGKHIDPSQKIDNQGTQGVKSTSRVALQKPNPSIQPKRRGHRHRRTLQQRGNHTNRPQKKGNSVLVYSTSTLGEPAQGNVDNTLLDSRDPRTNHSKGKRYGSKGKKGREKRRPAQPPPSDGRNDGVVLANKAARNKARRAAKAAARYSR